MSSWSHSKGLRRRARDCLLSAFNAWIRFRVQGLGFRIEGLGFRIRLVWGLSFCVQILIFILWDSGLRVEDRIEGQTVRNPLRSG